MFTPSATQGSGMLMQCFAHSHAQFEYDSLGPSCKRDFLVYSPASTNRNLLKKPQLMPKLPHKIPILNDFYCLNGLFLYFQMPFWVIYLFVPSVIQLPEVFQVK
jgi:hypothetical protein